MSSKKFQAVIESRRSIRKYDATKDVGRELVEKVIEAAILAPSWINAQTARYHCIMSEELRQAFMKECLPDFNRNSVKDAPVLIVPTYVKNRSGFERNGELTTEIGHAGNWHSRRGEDS